MKFSLFPRDAKFYDLFEKQADLICEICRAFHDLVHDYTDLETKVDRITELEHQGDDLFHIIARSLNETFVTPIDREDIYSIGSRMDDVLDLVQGSATRMTLFNIDKPKPAVVQMAEIMVQCASILRDGIKRLPGFQDISDLRKPLHELEQKGDQVNRQAVAELFDGCQQVSDVVALIKWKEIIENVEDAIDKFEDVFDVVESVVIKHA